MVDWILVLVLLILAELSTGHPRIVHPRVIPRAELSRDRRSAASNLQFVSLSEWILKTAPNDHLVLSPKFRIEGSRSYDSIEACETRQGLIHNRETDSRVLLTRCKDDFFGLVSVDNRTYLVEPLLSSNSSTHEHLLYEAEFSRTRRQASSTLYEASSRRFYNLTGDTFHEESYEGSLELMLANLGRNSELDGTNKKTSDEKKEEEDVAYFFDRRWYREKLPTRKTVNKYSPPKWLELAIVADYSVVDFHGSRVQQYLLALLNIVSAIYKDPSLDSNMQLVIVRMILYSDKKDGMVHHGNARRSLENVNRWNRKFLAKQINETYDVAIWLTRLDIGGPSGYAPVSGVCDPSRSCALNRDEGLTSAFIIAHEVAHILGLSHDGDKNSGNSCAREAARGSIMAPMVAATFHNFHWSTCSKKEFHRKAKHWTCLLNRPYEDGEDVDGAGSEIVRGSPNEIFSMDEQCRMEFGEGYSRCRSVEVSSLCAHLWCGRGNSSQPCKTKKGPPLEGTLCDQNKWCKNGMCESIIQKHELTPPMENSWSPWTECTKTCGTAVQYRTRSCTAGSVCQGAVKEFKLCNLPDCPDPVDHRVQQCSRFFDDRASLKNNFFDGNNGKNNNTWLPYESFDASPQCQLVCKRKETGEVFHTGIDLEDGMPCSYDTTDICVDGVCRSMGCDGVLGSGARRDACGRCGGTNSSCEIVAGKFQRKLRRDTTRLAVIPKSSNNIKVVVTILLADSVPHEGNMKILVRDGQRRRYEISEFDADGRAPVMIIEGAAFRIERLEEKYVLRSRGPVYSEVVVSLIASREVMRGGASIAVSWQCALARSELDRFRDRYSWVPGGPPGPCSVSCGGGVRRRTLLCRDESTGKLVPRRKCQLLPKPPRHQDLEKCNTGSCDYTWIPGTWDRCVAATSTTTANAECQGMQQRRLYCVRASFGERQVTRENELRVYRNTVAPSKCKDLSQPVTERECIRSSCYGIWVYSDWSSCSQSCGRGIQTRKALCVHLPSANLSLPDTSCDKLTKIPSETRVCKGSKSPECSRVDDEIFCRKDKAHFCQVARRDLAVKCKNAVFRKRCCFSCRGRTL